MVLEAAAFDRASRKALDRAGIIALLGGESNPLVADLRTTLAEEVHEYADAALTAVSGTEHRVDARTSHRREGDAEDGSDVSLEACFFDFEKNADSIQRFMADESAVCMMLREEIASSASVDEEDIRDAMRFICEELHKETQQVLERLSRESVEDGACELCDRVTRITRHHLRPRSTHSTYLRRGEFTREELSRVANLCRPCHNAVHTFIPDHNELAESYHSIPLLLQHERLFEHARWLSRLVGTRKPSVR